MRPTEQLMKEHRLIEKLLEVLASLAAKAEQGTGPDPARARDTLTFFREFADRCHHGKEEKHLFPRLAERGYGPEMGPVAVMLSEHVEGRAYLRAVGEALANLDAEGARERFAQAARGYVELLKGHIYKEDNILFRLADSVFTEDDQRIVEEGFAEVESVEMGEGAHERFHALAEELLEG
jgi:hemerythrin-like domain-containing protein